MQVSTVTYPRTGSGSAGGRGGGFASFTLFMGYHLDPLVFSGENTEDNAFLLPRAMRYHYCCLSFPVATAEGYFWGH